MKLRAAAAIRSTAPDRELVYRNVGGPVRRPLKRYGVTCDLRVQVFCGVLERKAVLPVRRDAQSTYVISETECLDDDPTQVAGV